MQIRCDCGKINIEIKQGSLPDPVRFQAQGVTLRKDGLCSCGESKIYHRHDGPCYHLQPPCEDHQPPAPKKECKAHVFGTYCFYCDYKSPSPQPPPSEKMEQTIKEFASYLGWASMGAGGGNIDESARKCENWLRELVQLVLEEAWR